MTSQEHKEASERRNRARYGEKGPIETREAGLMLSLVWELSSVNTSPEEIEARVSSMVNSGRYELTGNFRGKRIPTQGRGKDGN